MPDGDIASSIADAADLPAEDNTEALLELAGHGQPEPEALPPEDEAPPEEPASAPDSRVNDLEAQVSALATQLQTLTSILSQPAAPQAPEAPAAEEPPDLATAPADEYVRYHARQANKDLEAKLDALIEGLAPIQRRERFVGAYHEAAQELAVDPRTMSGKVAELMETDEDIRALADANPKAAARLALKFAQQAAVAPPPPPAPRAPQRRPVARPPSAASPRRVAGPGVPKSWGEAIQQTLREQGVPEGAHYTFTTTQGMAPEGTH